MQFDRRAFLATLGTAAAINAMPSEALADALEHHMIESLDAGTTTNELRFGSARDYCSADPCRTAKPMRS